MRLKWFVALILALMVPHGMIAASPAAASGQVPVTEAFATTPDGIGLYYRVAGEGEEVVIAPFALYHGNALDALAEGRRIVTYDPRGRGRSEAAPLDSVSLDHLLIDLDTIRAAVGAEKVAIIGWSGAGMETFVYALRNPDRVTRLVHLAPVAPRFVPYGAQMMEDRQVRTDQAAARKLEADIAAGLFETDPAGQCRARNAVTTPPLLANERSLGLIPDICVYSNEHQPALGAYFGALFRSISGYDWRDSLAQVTIPRLVVHGERDNIPLAGNEEWVQGQRNARLVIIPDAGHFPHYEQPELTIAALSRFLSGDWPDNSEALP